VAVATELVTKFTFEGSLNPLKLFNADLAGGVFLIGEFASAIIDASAAVASFVDQPLQAARSLEDFSRQTGVSVEAVQELGFAAEMLGSDMNAVQSSLTGLQSKIGEASMKGSEDFARLGISVRGATGHLKGADQVLNEVRVRFNQLGLSMAERRSLAGSLGIDESLLQLLGQSSSQLSELRQQAQELGVLTEAQTETALEYSNALKTQQFAISGLQNQISVGLAPELTELAEGFTDLLIENKDFIVDGIIATAEGIGALIDAFVRLAPFIAAAGAVFIVAKIAALGFGTVMGTIFSPVVLIAAAIAGALLVLDDLIVAFQGGNSVIADFLDSIFGIGATKFVLHEIVNTFIEALTMLKDFFVGWLTYFHDVFIGGITAGFDLVAGGVGKVAEFFGIGGEDSTGQLAGATAGGGTTVSNNSVAQTNQITVVSSDPAAAGQSVNDALQKQLRNAEDQMNKGGI
jgi:hypothetical protein